MDENLEVSISPAEKSALHELAAMIAAQFPGAELDIRARYDPPGISLHVTVDIDDPLDVYEIVADRLLDMQVYEGLSIYVVPEWPIERILADFEARRASGVPWMQRSA